MAVRKGARKLILLVLLILMPTGGAAADACPSYSYHIAGRSACSSEKIACYHEQQAQIIDAYFNPPHEDVCSGNCTPGPKPEKFEQCHNTELNCWQRLGLKELSKLYSLCPTNCTLSTFVQDHISVQSKFFVEYICVAVQRIIDPCTTMSTTKANPSILLQSEPESCYSVCVISPTDEDGAISFHYNFLTNATQPSNTVQYEIEYRSKNHSTWTPLCSLCYYTHGFTERNVARLQISFQLPEPARVTRLWIHFNASAVNITCFQSTTTTPGLTASTQGFTSTQKPTPIQRLTTTHGSTTTARPTSSHVTEREKDDTEESVLTAESALVIACVAVAAAVLVVLGTVVVFCIRRRRRGGKATPKADDHGPLPSKPADPAPPHGDGGAYSECFMDDNPTSQRGATPRDMNLEPLLAARTGCDAGDEYGRLQRDGARVVVMTAGGNEVYDHVTSEEGVYNVLQRENKKREIVVDNIYNTTSNL